MSDLAVGIDLGTTNTCVGVYLHNRVKILENKEGGRTTPSYIFFMNPTTPIVGYYAKRMAESKPDYGIYEIKRLIGRQFNDPYVQRNLNYLPFQVKEIQNEPVIFLEHKTELVKKTPTDLCTNILKKIKNDIESKLGPISKAVITVPAYFNISQREATLQAARQAGFTVLKLFNEPTAAALSFYFQNECPINEMNYSLVYDLGGGTFDVAILKREGTDIEIIGVDGDSHLGGHDFDNLLVDFACQHLRKKYNFNPKDDRRLMLRLKSECEEAKKILSVVTETQIILNAYVPSHNSVEIPITRDEFEKMAGDLFEQTIEIVKRCLQKVNLRPDDIKEIVMSGGSTRIPKLELLLSNFFGGRTICKFVNPDECVADGAALQAAMISEDPRQDITNVQISDVTALTLGISNFVGVMTPLIERNTKIPTTTTTSRITVYDNQSSMHFDIYEGERLDCSKNYYLGNLELEELTLAPPGQCTVSLKMTIDQNGILTVSATESVSNKTKDAKIVYTRGLRSDNEIRSAVVNATENKTEDLKFEKFAEIKAYALKFCIRAMYNFKQKGLIKQYQEQYDRCHNIANKLKHLGVEDEQEVNKLKHEVVGICSPIVKRYNFELMP